MPQQQRVRDSLLTLQALRASLVLERQDWQGAGRAYNAALDSLTSAYLSSQAQLANQAQRTAMYRTRAHRKGWLLVLLVVALEESVRYQFTHR